jgi:hypothetical protein
MHIRLKIVAFWDITPCTQLKANRRFGGTYHLYLQGRKKIEQDNSVKAGGKSSFICAILVRLFDPENEGEMFLRNIGWLSTNYTALCSRR